MNSHKEYTLPETFKKIVVDRNAFDIQGNLRVVDDAISYEEGKILYEMLCRSKAVKTIEIGVAHGASALIFCSYAKANNGRHYGVDPNQTGYYNSAAVAALQKENLLDSFKLLEQPSHLALTKLIEAGETFDCAFIDGWHTFDYTLLDFFLLDKLVKPGGYIGFHDFQNPSKQKVVRYVQTHRKYEIVSSLRVKGNESRFFSTKFFLWRMLKHPYLLFSKLNWRYMFRNSSGLLILRKLENFEPDYSFYKPF